MQQPILPELIKSKLETFTMDDYLNTAPYEWLYSFRDNAFQTERLRWMLLQDAAKKGVKNAGNMWRSYLKTQLGGRELSQNVTAFSAQEKELQCGEYECYDDGVQIQNGYGGVVKVCSHPIMPVSRLVNIDSGLCRTEIAFRRGNAWRKMVFDKATLSSARSITELSECGISVNSETARELVKYLSYLEDTNYDEIPEIKTVGRLGWVDGYGFSPYVEGLQYDGTGLYGDAFKAVHASGSFEKWMQLAHQVRAGKSVPCRIALAASFASVLVPKLDALPFILHLWGSASGIGKSVALILAASVWAYPDIGAYVKTTKSTNVGYEQMAAFCGNLPLCMDELQMIQGKKEFDELIYSLCEGVSKTRGAKTGGIQRVQHWRNAILTTGEQPITTANSKAGAVNRVIEVECTEKLFDDPRAAYQLLVKNYGHAGKAFVHALMQDPCATEILLDTQKAFYERLQGFATDKQILSASILLAADTLADYLLFNDACCLRAEDLLPYLATSRQSDTNRRAYEWLCDLVASNPGKFAADSYEEYRGECWGCVDGDKAYIIKSIFEREMNAAGFHPASFLSWADKEGKLIKDKGHRTKIKRIRGVTAPARCVCILLPTENEWEESAKNIDVSTDSDVLSVFQMM